jgi:hypothetical protein
VAELRVSLARGCAKITYQELRHPERIRTFIQR